MTQFAFFRAFRSAVVVAFGAVAVAAQGSAARADGPVQQAGTLQGAVSDSRGRPLGGAALRVTGAGRAVSGESSDDGTFRFSLPAGVYDLEARKGGYQDAEEAAVALPPGGAVTLTIRLAEATTSNLRVIGSVRTRGNVPSSSVTAVSSLPATTLPERQSIALQDVLPEIAGVTFSRGTSADPYEYFAVRGGLTETRVQIDGHPISLGSSGKFNLDQIDPQVFGNIDVVKGAQTLGIDAGESVFGTIDLRTRDFTPDDRALAQLGVDGYGAQYSVFAASGNLLPENRLSYVFDYNVAGQVGPENGILANEVYPDGNGHAVVAFQDYLNDSVRETSELAKLRYRFSGATSLSAGFVGFQGTQNPQGIAYGTSVGSVTLVPSFVPAGSTTPVYTAPYAHYANGTTVTGYQWFPGTVTYQNEPFFEAELRTTLHNDTLLLRPYTGVITRTVDGNAEANLPDGQFGLAWSLVADATTCTAALPCYPGGSRSGYTTATNPCARIACYQPQNDYAYDEIEVNRLHGTTFTYLHPYGDNLLNFTYDYHSDFTYNDYGNPAPGANNGTIGSGYTTSVAPTTAKTNAFGLATTLALTPALRLAVGEFLTNWNLDYQIEDPAVVAAHPDTNELALPLALVGRSRALWHSDPHIGVNYRPNSNLALRLSAGSGLTVPYASQVSGVPSISAPSGTTNEEAVLVNVNPNLNPETTVAYDLGADVLLPNRTLASVDFFDNAIHNAFIQSIFPLRNPPKPAPGQNPYGLESQWFNGPLERMYGLELTLRSPGGAPFGYYATGTFERAYYDQLPASFYTSGPSSAINGAQIAGVSQIPYVQAHGELRYAPRPGTRLSFGADYTGANNWTYGPAFTTFFATLQQDARSLGTFRVSVDNLFGRGNGDPYGIAIQNGGFSTVQLGPAPAGRGLVYSAQSEPLQSVLPRTFRFSLEKRFGT